MKISLVLAVALGLATAGANAVKLNPDAMRAMQEEGERKLQQAMQPRAFRLSSGLCLQRGGDGNVFAGACAAKNAAQKWHFDKHGRVVHNSGTCLAVAGKPGSPGSNVVTQGCGKSAHFKWKPQKNGQLVNAGKACLQAVGNINKSGANVNLGGCKAGPAQVWK